MDTAKVCVRVCVHAVYVMSFHVSSLTKLQWREHKKTSDLSTVNA